MVSVNEAWRLLETKVVSLSSESVELVTAGGRVLHQSLKADRDYPPFDRVAMDGYALTYASWLKGQRRFQVQEMQTAGQQPATLRSAEFCIEIMTGAKLSNAADLVIRYEDTERDGDFVKILDGLELEAFANIHRQGKDCARETAFNDPIIRSTSAAIAASFGLGQIKVARRPRISIIGTGDELVSIDQQPLDYQIRTSNIHAVRMALEMNGHQVLLSQTVADQRGLIAQSVVNALETSDLLLLSGGVSAGKTDYIPAVLKECGVEEVFHKIEQRPGKPLWFGQTKSGTSVFGLPGNPVSTLICLHRYVLPFIQRMQGLKDQKRPYVELLTPRPKNRKLTFFLPLRIRYTPDAKILGESVAHNGSGDFVALSLTDGFVEIPGEGEAQYDPNQNVFPFYSW